MALERLSDMIYNFSFKDLINGDPEVFISLIYLIVSIAFYSVLIWHFYRFIAKRDCFQIPYAKHPILINMLKYSIIFPLVALLFFVGFSLMMLFLTRSYEISAILSTSFGIIIAIRLTAYYNENLSKDVAKMLPFALLGLFLVDPSYFNFNTILNKIQSLPNFFNQVLQFLIIIIIVEWILRSILIIKRWINLKRKNISNKKRIKLPVISQKITN